MMTADRSSHSAPFSRTVGDADAALRGRGDALLGKVLGQYRIVSVLGNGGSGTVYLGERADKQYSAQVAVKVIDERAP